MHSYQKLFFPNKFVIICPKYPLSLFLSSFLPSTVNLFPLCSQHNRGHLSRYIIPIEADIFEPSTRIPQIHFVELNWIEILSVYSHDISPTTRSISSLLAQLISLNISPILFE